MSEKTKQLVLDKRKEGKLVYTGLDSFISVDVSEFIKQPTDGILYDLNRLEETALTFIDDPKWVNDFAVALTIRALKVENEALTTGLLEIKAAMSQRYQPKRVGEMIDALLTTPEDTPISDVPATP